MLLTIIRWTLILSFCLITIFFIAFSPSHLDHVIYKGNTIKIDRDKYGFATLHVTSIEEYLYGLGTIVAEDRLFQMTLRSYALQGRLSQFLGQKSLDFDRFMREVNLKKWANLRAQRLKKENYTQYAIFKTMSKGINDRVAKMRILPMQFYLTGAKWQNFTINHLFYFIIQFQWAVSMNAVDEYTRSYLLANHTKQEIDWILPNTKEHWAFKSKPIVSQQEIPERLRTKKVEKVLKRMRFNPLSVDRMVELDIIEFFGTLDSTNVWAISGNYTESGLPFVGNDPHLENIVPSHLYPFRVKFTYPNGKFSFAFGSTTPGSSILFGKTSYFAAGYSISHGDSQDLFREKIEGDRYFVDGKWRDLVIRNETIIVKTPNGIRTDNYIVRETHRGPIIHYIFSSLGSYNLENDTISLSWTGFNTQWQSTVQYTYLFFVDNFNDLRDLLQNKTKGFYCVNILAVTVDNHIMMQQTGIHPIRRVVQSGNYIKDGTTTEHDWVGIVPAEDRMHIVDPPKGYIINSNNKVAESEYYGGYLDYTIYTARYDRIDQLIQAEIAAGRKFNGEWGKKVLMDTVDVYCRQILPEILEVVPQARQSLSNFTCNFSVDSTQSSQYQMFLFQLYHLMKPFTPTKISLISFHQMQQGIFNYIHFAFRGDTAKQAVMREAWRKAIAHLTQFFKTSDSSKWYWGQLHPDHAKHAPFRAHPILSKFFDLTFPGAGNMHTPNMGRMEIQQFSNFETSLRASTRSILGYGAGHEDWFILDTGVSQNILSKHFSDQWELFQRGELLTYSNTSSFQTGQL